MPLLLETIPDHLQLFLPSPQPRSIEWFVANVSTHEGKPYDHRAYPHLGAPGGPCDALDHGPTLEIVLQWATRLGKTFFGEAATLYMADVTPGPAMFASSVEDLALDVTARTVRMIEHCPRLAPQLAPPHRRNSRRIELDACRVHIAWSRSVSTLADKPVRFGHANEIDKWVHEATSSEADPLKLFTDRFKEFARYKRLLEGTPTIHGQSRIEAARLTSTDCRFHVPCPHCGHYQTLRMEQIAWSKPDDDETDRIELARQTAHYVCESCQGEIVDSHRPTMLRHGVWCPAGCTIDNQRAAAAARLWQQRLDESNWYGELTAAAKGADDETLWRGWQHADWIIGTPRRGDRVAGYQLSSLYAASLTWGDIAAEFLTCKGSPSKLQNFRNQWLGETWERIRRRHTWEAIAERLSVEYTRGLVPASAWFLTAGVDVQEDHCWWIVRAWGAFKTSWLIDFGRADKIVSQDTGGTLPFSDLQRLQADIVDRWWNVDGQTTDGYERLTPAVIAIDTGHRIFDVHAFMRQLANPRIRAVAGDAAVKAGYYRRALLERNARTGKPYEGGLVQWQLNVDAFKDDIRAAWDHAAGEAGAWYLPREMKPTSDNPTPAPLLEYLKQVTNEQPEDEVTAHGHTRRRWKVVDASMGNHYWDCEVYSRAAAEMLTEGDWAPVSSSPPPREQQQPSSSPTRRTQTRRTMRRR